MLTAGGERPAVLVPVNDRRLAEENQSYMDKTLGGTLFSKGKTKVTL